MTLSEMIRLEKRAYPGTPSLVTMCEHVFKPAPRFLDFFLLFC